MLDSVAQLAQHAHGDIRRGLGDEVHPHALGADQPHHLLDLLQQGLGAVAKKQVRLIEEEHHAGLVQVALLGQQLVQLGKHPQHEGGVHGRMQEQLVRRQDVDHAPAFLVQLQPVRQIQRRLAEEAVAALILQHRHRPLDGPHRSGGHVAVIQRVIPGVLAQVGQHGLEVLQIHKEHALVIRHAEEDVHDPGLGLVQPQHPGQQNRAHLADGGAHGMPLLAIHVPEHRGEVLIPEAGHAAAAQPLGQRIAVLAGHGHASQVTLHIAEEHRHAHGREALGQHLQGHRLARARRTGDQAVAVGHLRQQAHGRRARANPDFSIVQHAILSSRSICLYCTRERACRQEQDTIRADDVLQFVMMQRRKALLSRGKSLPLRGRWPSVSEVG